MKKLTLLILLSLTACKTVGPDYQRADAKLPEAFNEADSGQSEVVIKSWWKKFNDQQLNELVDLALHNNTNVQLAAARIEEVDANMREIGASLFPEVRFSTSGTRTKITELGANPVFGTVERNDFRIGLSTSYEIDFWGRIRRAKEAARASALASRDAKETTELSLAGLVTSYYLQLASLNSQIALTQENQKNRDESLALTKRRLAGGIASALEVSQAEVSVSNLQAQLIDLNRQRALTLHQLQVLTGELNLKLGQSDIRQLPVPPVPPAGMPSDLLENRPDIREAEQNLIAQNANIGIAKAALYPSITLTGQFGGESAKLTNLLKPGAHVWTWGLGLDLPIFDAGARNARVDQATAKQKQALAQYQTAIQSAFKEVNDALVNRRLNAEREQVLVNSANSAKNALNVAENRYKAGYSAYLDVLDAQRVYNDAAIAALQARQSTLGATVELLKSLGGDWREGTPDTENVPE